MDELKDADFWRKVEELEYLADELFPDPFDIYEDLLAEQLGIIRHPAMMNEQWRRARVKAIGGCGELADLKAKEVEGILDETDWPYLDRRDELGL